MSRASKVSAALAVVSLFVSSAYAAPQYLPERRAFATYNSDTANIPTATPVGPASQTVSIYGNPALQGYNPANPIQTQDTVIPPSDFSLAPGQDADPKLGFYLDLSAAKNPQPIRGSTDAPTDPGPRTPEYEILNSDQYAPPGTDNGAVPQAQWPLGLSHNRHGTPGTAGYARQQNVNQLPAATEMAGVDMRLSPNAYRELHWHKANEWAYILNGTARIAASNEAGQNFLDDVSEGDVWFFPAGVPHSIQAGSNGVEFLLIFDDGSFSEDNTFLATELFLRNPKSVLAKNLRTDVSAFDNLPDQELYIFPGTPYPEDIEKQNQTGPSGIIPQKQQYSFHWSEQKQYNVPGGSLKVIDSSVFPIADNFAAALVTIEPGAMREIHWHPTSDEWNFFIAGQGRITVYSAPSSSGTFDFTAGDVGYIPVPDAHYIENTGNETIVFLEVLQAPRFSDISVNQWLGLTPKQVVKDTLNLTDEVIDRLPNVKPYILPGNKNLTATNFTDTAL